MTEQSPLVSKSLAIAPRVPSFLQTVVVFPDGSVMWEEPEPDLPPMPYAGYELPPLKDRRLEVAYRQATANGVEIDRHTRAARWLAAGVALALLAVGFGAMLPQLITTTSTGTGPSTCPPLEPLELHRSSTRFNSPSSPTCKLSHRWNLEDGGSL